MKIEILVGTLASGKSTYARKRADEGAIVISLDDVCRMIHAREHYDRRLESLYHGCQIDMALRAIRMGLDVVVDDTHTTRRSRRRWTESFEIGSLHPSRRPQIIAVQFPSHDAPAVYAARRFRSDPRGKTYAAWLAACKRKRRNIAKEPLSDDEGFDRIEVIS